MQLQVYAISYIIAPVICQRKKKSADQRGYVTIFIINFTVASLRWCNRQFLFRNERMIEQQRLPELTKASVLEKEKYGYMCRYYSS
jgi:hypothetical protein